MKVNLYKKPLERLFGGMGLKSFVPFSGLKVVKVQRALNIEYNPTKETLESLLEPFDLTLGAKEKNIAAS